MGFLLTLKLQSKHPRYGGRGEDVNRYAATSLEILGVSAPSARDTVRSI